MRNLILFWFGLSQTPIVHPTAQDEEECLVKGFPVYMGEELNDSETIIQGMALDTFSDEGGYWLSGRTTANALQLDGSDTFALHISKNLNFVEGFGIKHDDYDKIGVIAADDSSPTVALTI